MSTSPFDVNKPIKSTTWRDEMFAVCVLSIAVPAFLLGILIRGRK